MSRLRRGSGYSRSRSGRDRSIRKISQETERRAPGELTVRTGWAVVHGVGCLWNGKGGINRAFTFELRGKSFGVAKPNHRIVESMNEKSWNRVSLYVMNWGSRKVGFFFLDWNSA